MLADLLFPNITQTPETILNKYKKRPEGKNVTRIAPSPTWFLHIWAVYSTLIDKVVANFNNWILYLRIEDTDQKREIEWARQKYVTILKQFGFEFDEWPIWENFEDVWEYWPYIQSQREDIYKIFIKDLVAKGLAYPCFLTEQEINDIREIQEVSKVPTWIYKEFSPWRNASFDEVKAQIDAWKEFVIRFKSPWEIVWKIVVNDLIKGEISIWENFLDIVIMKVDWIPTYHFAHLIDDHLMWTTHVIRWDEWFASLPLHKQLFNMMWWESPNYAHYWPLVKMDWDAKRKISKRKDPEADVEYYFQEWYLIDSIIDFLANLLNSWFEEWRAQNPHSSYLEYDFKLNKIWSSWALVDIPKLNWVNQQRIKNMQIEDLQEKIEEYLKKYNNEFYTNYFSKASYEYNQKIIKELQTRIVKFNEFEELTWFFYKENEVTQKAKELLVNPKMKIDDLNIAKSWLNLALKVLSDLKTEEFSLDEIKNLFVEAIKEAWMKNWQVLWPVRVALTSEEFSVWALELMYILWREKSINRIQKFLNDLI